MTIASNDLGAHWMHNYDARLDVTGLSQGNVVAYDPVGLPHYFTSVAAGAAAYDNITGMTLSLNSGGNSYTLKNFANQQWTYNSIGQLMSVIDRIGNVQQITRDGTSGHSGRILNVKDPLGRALCFYYGADSTNRITGLAWETLGSCPSTLPTVGTIVKMIYDTGTKCATGQLCGVTEADGATWSYQYDASTNQFQSPTDNSFVNDLTEVLDPVGDPEEANIYSGNQVVSQQTGKCSGASPCADTGDDLSFSYNTSDIGDKTVKVTDGLGRLTTFQYNNGTQMPTSIVGPLCNCGGDQTETFAYDTYDRLLRATDDGIDGSTLHAYTLTYGRDASGVAYPEPTQIVENLTSSGATRTTTIRYYGIGPLEDLPYITTPPSTSGMLTVTDTYFINGELKQRQIDGMTNGSAVSYIWAWTYDSRGRIKTATGPRGTVNGTAETSAFTYYSDATMIDSSGQLEYMTDPYSHKTAYGSLTGNSGYNPFGTIKALIDPNGVETDFTYDGRGRPTSSTLLGVAGDSANLVTKWVYDAAGRLTSTTLPAGNGIGLDYDTSDRLGALRRLDVSGKQHERAVFTYNVNDQPTGLTAQACTTPATSCPSWNTTWSTQYGYSSTTGDLVKILNPGTPATSEQFTYTGQGALATFNDENHPTGFNYSYAYDVAGRELSETRLLSGASGGSVSSKATYDVHDNVTSVTDENGNMTSYTYDDFDRVTAIGSPVQGKSTFSYDADSNLISSMDSNGATTTYTYDALNRELSETSVRLSQSLASTWMYDMAPQGQTCNFCIGQVSLMTDPSGSTAYSYERRGNVASETKSVVGNVFTQAYAYDANGNRNSVTYPDGAIVGYSFDFADRPYSAAQTGMTGMARSAEGVPKHSSTLLEAFKPESPSYGIAQAGLAKALPLLRHVGTLGMPGRANHGLASNDTGPALAGLEAAAARKHLSGGPSYVSAATYEPFGPISGITFGNGTVQTLTYNQRYFPVENTLANAPSTLDYAYTEDAVGNVTSIVDKRNTNLNRTFGPYDDLNRLTTANSGTSAWGTASGNGYTYDAMGNIKTSNLGSLRNQTFTYKGTLPELTSVLDNGKTRAIAYDPYGNMTNDGYSALSYSSRELLGSDSQYVSTYYYNGLRQRVSTQLSSNNKFRDSLFDPDSNLLSETAQFTSGTPSIDYDYIWFGDRPVAQVDSSGTYWTFSDFLGTPTYQSNSAATFTWEGEYEPYGNIFKSYAGGPGRHQPLRLPGQTSEQFDGGLNGLTERSYNNARWYQSDWGRYSQSDPMQLRAGLNIFRYADGSPTRTIDPSGQLSFSPYETAVGAGALFGGLTDAGEQMLFERRNLRCIDWGGVIFGAIGGSLGSAVGGLSMFRSKGEEWSHSIPDKYFRPRTRSGENVNPDYIESLPGFLRNSRLNGNYRTADQHYLEDSQRMLKGSKKLDTDTDTDSYSPAKYPAFLRPIARTPGFMIGGLGGAVGGTAADASRRALTGGCYCR